MTATLAPEMGFWAKTTYEKKYAQGETWDQTAQRLAEVVVGPHFPDQVEAVAEVIRNFEFIPGGRQIANAGRSNMLNNCFLYRVQDTKEGIGDFFRKGAITGMTGGGVGAVWSDLRPRGYLVKSNGGASTGPCAFMYSFNEIGRGVVNGGSRRMAIWAGLHWWHPDVFEFMSLKDWSDEVKAAKEKDFSAYGPMDMTNISVILDDEFFTLMNGEAESVEIDAGWGRVTVDRAWAEKVYTTAVEKMLTTGEPGFSVDIGENRGENLRNPCCEITSYDDSDVCCLGSVNLARIKDEKHMARVTELGTTFLLCSTLVSEVPHAEVLETRKKNRRLGLGLMGVYEWLVSRGHPYAPNAELGQWLSIWENVSDRTADTLADRLGVSRPVKKRGIAPNGTLSIVAETTSSGEPLFAGAYKRRYLDGTTWKYQMVVDATAQRMVDDYGIDPADLETAYDLAYDPERRLAMQAFLQSYTDHAISSTLNLPSVDQQPFTTESFAATLLEYLPRLRGITAYPDGARGGQPINVVPLEDALANEGIEFEEFGLEQACVSGVCGI